ncbi:protein tyrosine phosphatase domain-containing protein 1 [Aplochiton taeniatus]
MAAGVSLLSELPYFPRGAYLDESNTEMEPASTRVPTAKYTKVGERLRHVIPGHMQCSMACGGKACKYENPTRWSDEEQAVKGLFSSWITDNLLAMARPSTEIIEKYNIIDQFQRCGLRTVINLQRPGEHASCGNPLEPESGFTYRPETFMEAGIYFYNFGWKDYGVASLTTILDMVKVMSFAIQEGKMAVHCHAGLGRTGVLLACYLVFTSRMSADQAILFVRAKRPNSIQTRGQLLCVREFAQFLVPLRNVFSSVEPKSNSVTLSQYLTRQRHLLHGYEARQMKNVPKIVQLVCKLLLDIAANRHPMVEEEVLEIPDLTAEVEKTVSQQAIQQLGKEMRGKGIPVPSPSLCGSVKPPAVHPKQLHDQPLASDYELDPLWRRQNTASVLLRPIHNGKRSLSYSDSALHKEGTMWDPWSGNRQADIPPFRPLNKYYLSQSNLTACEPFMSPDLPPQDRFSSGSPFVIPDSVREQKSEMNQSIECPVSQGKKKLHKGQRSLSLGFCEEVQYTNGSEILQSLETDNSVQMSKPSGVAKSPVVVEEKRDISPITLQAELSLEARRLLVAKALAINLSDKDLSEKVSVWQHELNSREGAWERMCLERDPLVLSSLMWSWLEQLKEPIISTENVHALQEKHYNPQHALESLEKCHRLTLLCILDCLAHLLAIPEEVEAVFLNRTINVFTKIDISSENDQDLFKTLKSILTPVLHEMREKAIEEKSSSCHSTYAS